MALKIRLARGGAKQRPFYRIVIAEADAPRDGRFVEKVGTYNPMLQKTNPTRVVLNTERLKYWLSVGAQPTDRVARFLAQENIIATPTQKNNPQKGLPKKKAQERLKEEADRLKNTEEKPQEMEIPVSEDTQTPLEEDSSTEETPVQTTPSEDTPETAAESVSEEPALSHEESAIPEAKAEEDSELSASETSNE